MSSEEEIFNHLHATMERLDDEEGPIVKDGYPIGGPSWGNGFDHMRASRLGGMGPFSSLCNEPKELSRLEAWIMFGSLGLALLVAVAVYFLAP